jgi:3-methyladenine DNA glycosylase AlkD
MANKIEHTASHLKRRLKELASPERRRSTERFFKEPVRCLGVSTPDVRRLSGEAAKEYRGAKLEFQAILNFADRLWRGGILEERVLAVVLLARFKHSFTRDHWDHLDSWVDGLTNWGETDGLCCEVLAPLIVHDPSLARRLLAWTHAPGRWRRRAAAVALVKAARAGDHHDLAFQICDSMAEDRDDMVEKGVGWLLKEMSRTEPNRVAEYLLANISRLSRTTVRYACEKLPSDLRQTVMSA